MTKRKTKTYQLKYIHKEDNQDNIKSKNGKQQKLLPRKKAYFNKDSFCSRI